MKKILVPSWANFYRIEQCESCVKILYYKDQVEESHHISELLEELCIGEARQAMRNNKDWRTLPKQDRYKDKTGTKDFIDESYETMSFEQFVGAMRFTIGKYFNRFSRKDKLSSESYKIMDYATRFHEKVLLEEQKRSGSKVDTEA